MFSMWPLDSGEELSLSILPPSVSSQIYAYKYRQVFHILFLYTKEMLVSFTATKCYLFLTRHNSHIIQFTYLKFCGFQYIHIIMQPSPQLTLEHCLHSREKPVHITRHSPSSLRCLSPEFQATTYLFPVHVDLPIPDILHKCTHTRCILL